MVVDVLEEKADAAGLLSCFFCSAAVAMTVVSAALAAAVAAATVKADAVPSSGSSFFCAAAEMAASNQPVSLVLRGMDSIPFADPSHRAAA